MFVGLTLAILVAAAAWHRHAERALSALPAEVRIEAFQDSLRNLTDNCLAESSLEGPLRRHCLHEADFVLRFPECNADCRAIARSVFSRAHR